MRCVLHHDAVSKWKRKVLTILWMSLLTGFRLCVELGAQVTWSEMAMGLPLLQGEKSEWALMKAHESETRPVKFEHKNTVVRGYDNTKDLKFGVQIAANKPWLATKTVEVLTSLCPQLRAIDLNCGCPINLVCEQGSGSALLDSPSRLENVLRGMNYVSGEIPISVKIRMGTKDGHPTAEKLIKRLVLGGYEAVELGKGTAGVAAITLHGRSKQQRYTRSADWSYIAECSSLIDRLKQERSVKTDTLAEVRTPKKHAACPRQHHARCAKQHVSLFVATLTDNPWLRFADVLSQPAG
jgi:tRNA-dihydrouridine synthase 3